MCASDGFNYADECLIRLQSCRAQKPIWVVQKGSCPDSGEPGASGTEIPMRRWTGIDYTEPGGDESYIDNHNNYGGKKVHPMGRSRRVISHPNFKMQMSAHRLQ